MRRLAPRVPGGRARRRRSPAPPAVAVTLGDNHRVDRADPVLRWTDPCDPPSGDFAACAVPNGRLDVEGVPRRGDPWETVSSFCLSYDGYAYWDDVSELAARCLRRWTRDRAVPATIDEVRGCLFFEQRRWHHFGEDPNGRGAQYVGDLLDTLRGLVASCRLPLRPDRPPAPASSGDRTDGDVTASDGGRCGDTTS